MLISILFLAATAVDHVHLVDQAGPNLLFRGGAPEVNKVFSYSALVASLQAAANVSKVPFPKAFNLTVINVENLVTSWTGFTTEDGTNVISEHNYFAKNPSMGKFYFWHMVGTSSIPADSVFDGQREWLAQSYQEWGSDKLVERIEALKTLLQTKEAFPQIIYGHCDCGCDRTGQTFGGYRMKYHGQSWDAVVSQNAAIAGRPQTCPTHHQMQWYCLYLNITEGISTTGNCLTKHLCTPI